MLDSTFSPFLPNPIPMPDGYPLPEFLIERLPRDAVDGPIRRSRIRGLLEDAGWTEHMIDLMMESGNRLPWYPEEQDGEFVTLVDIVGFSNEISD